jgi:guanylate kinase
MRVHHLRFTHPVQLHTSMNLTPSPAAPRGTLFIVSGPSGVGKGSILKAALPQLGAIRMSVSVTTRPPRPGEIHEQDYIFLSDQAFDTLRTQQDLLEHATVHGHSYGTPRSWVLQQLATGMDVVLEIDVQGALQVKALCPDAVLIFIAPPSWRELTRRLRGRDTEDEATITRRLTNAHQELSRVAEYEYVIINATLATAIAHFLAIVIAERCRPWRQPLKTMLPE